MLQRDIAPALQPGRARRDGEGERLERRAPRDGDPVASAVDSTASAPFEIAADASLTALYRAHVGRVYRYVYSRVGIRQDAEDITAQVFLAAVDAVADGEPPREPAAWLLAIARRRVADHFRRRRPTAELAAAADLPDDRPDAGADPLRGILAGEDMERLDGILAALPETDLELLRLRFAAGLTFGEAAQVLGKAEGAVKMAVHRLLRRMALDWEVSDARTV